MNHKYICHISNIRYVGTLKYQIHDMLTTCGKFEATIGSTQSEDLDTLSCPTSLCTSARCLSQVSVNQKNQKKVWIVDFKCTYSKSKKCKKHQNSVHTGHITNPHWGVVGYDLNIYQWPFEAAITWQNSATHEALKGHGRCACTSAERCGVPRPGTMERTRQWRFHTHPEYVAYISETTSNPSVSPMSRLFSTTPFVTFWTYQITTRSQPLLNIHPKSNSSSWTLFFLKISLSLDMYTGCCCKIQRSSWNSYVGGFFCLGNFGSQKPFSGRTWGVVLKVQQFLFDVNVCLHLEIRNTIQGIVEETWMCSRGEWRWNSHPWLSHQERMWLQNGSYILGGQEAKFKNWIPNMSKPMSSSSTSISSWAWPGSWQNCTCPFTITNWCPMASDIAGLHLKFSHEKIIWNGYHNLSCHVMLCYVMFHTPRISMFPKPFEPGAPIEASPSEGHLHSQTFARP